MSDDKGEIVLHKDAGRASVKFPMLTTSNYTVWSMRMKIALKVSEVWESIDLGTEDMKKNNMAIYSVSVPVHTGSFDHASW